MRLLYVCSDFGVRPNGTKGASAHLRSITRALSELGNEILLLSPREGPGDGHPATQLLPPGCPPAKELSRLLKPWLTERGFGDALARELRPLVYNAWVVDAATEALRHRPPTAIIERLALFSHLGVDLADRFRIPIILEANAPLTREAQTFRGLQVRGLAEEIEDRVLKRADAIIAVSSTLAESLMDRGVAPERIHVVPNGVDMRAFQNLPSKEECRAELGLRDQFVIGFMGSLKPWHGVESLLEVCTGFLRDDETTRLLIVGTGPEEEKLRSAARAAGIAHRVCFAGAVPHSSIPGMLRAMDVAVAPYPRVPEFYFSPIKLFEYMASGACVVAPRLGQIEEVLENGVTGLLYDAGDNEQLRSVLQRARSSPELRSRLGDSARRIVSERYTWIDAAKATLAAVTGTIDRGRIPDNETVCAHAVGRAEGVE